MPYDQGHGCPKCRFAPNGCTKCRAIPYTIRKGRHLTPEDKECLRRDAIARWKKPNTKSSHPVTVSGSVSGDIRSIRVGERYRYLCGSPINANRISYGLKGFAQCSSCECTRCYSTYMPRQWSNDLRQKLNKAIRYDKNYVLYQPLISMSRNSVISILMDSLRRIYGVSGETSFEEENHKYQIDEIVPRGAFYSDVNDVDHIVRIFNGRNLQFLTAKDNSIKAGRILSLFDVHKLCTMNPTEGARRVVIDHRLGWIRRREMKGLPLLTEEKEFLAIHDRSEFF